MKKTIFNIVFVMVFLFTVSFSQRIGKTVPDSSKIDFPPTTMGFNLIFSDGGFGVGYIFEREISNETKIIFNVKIAEEKSPKEYEYFDYWGRPVIYGKENRVFTIPFYVGINQRLFPETVTDNLRPFIIGGIAPALVVTSKYDRDIFKGFDKAKAYFGASASLGFGADFGINQKNLMGISFQYHYTHLFNDGVEMLKGIKKKDFGGLHLQLRIGWMW